jgi:hypothetical protein
MRWTRCPRSAVAGCDRTRSPARAVQRALRSGFTPPSRSPRAGRRCSSGRIASAIAPGPSSAPTHRTARRAPAYESVRQSPADGGGERPSPGWRRTRTALPTALAALPRVSKPTMLLSPTPWAAMSGWGKVFCHRPRGGHAASHPGTEPKKFFHCR